VNFKRNLVAVDHSNKMATFKLLDSESGEEEKYKVNMFSYHCNCGNCVICWTNFVF
jgi:hypothetical protein